MDTFNFWEYIGINLKRTSIFFSGSRVINRLGRLSISVKTNSAHVDLIDRYRFLLFRLLTAIGFAIILLATGYLAKIWEIPLPLLRIVG